MGLARPRGKSRYYARNRQWANGWLCRCKGWNQAENSWCKSCGRYRLEQDLQPSAATEEGGQ
jgi:hypothetical protein